MHAVSRVGIPDPLLNSLSSNKLDRTELPIWKILMIRKMRRIGNIVFLIEKKKNSVIFKTAVTFCLLQLHPSSELKSSIAMHAFSLREGAYIV